MNEAKLVSIIIPAYNTEKYIDSMIECLIHQTYSNLQMIFIDDGSTDLTAKKIKEKAEKDDRIEYYFQKNAGVSAARNFGLTKAKGEKIFFFDSDDTFALSLIGDCIRFADDYNVESVLYGYGNNTDGVIEKEHVFQLHGVYHEKDIYEKVIPHFLGHSYSDINDWITGKRGMREGKEHTALWRIMLDRKVILDHNIQFDINLSLGEDTKFMNTYLLFSSSVGILEKTLYYLTIREGSANVLSNENPILMAKNKMKLIEARKEIDNIAKKLNMETNQYWQGTLIFSAIQLIIRLSHNKGISIKENIKVLNHYIENQDVKKAIKNFTPTFKVKGIPFVLLKFHLEKIFFMISYVVPQKIINQFL